MNTTPPVIRSTWVPRTPADAFRIFTDEIGAWWPIPTHGVFGETSGGVAFVAGQVVERSLDGQTSVWAEVAVWEPPTRVTLSWHPGRGADDASIVDVQFEPDGDGTRVVLEHHGWESFGRNALERRRPYVGPNAWGYTLDHFASGAEADTAKAELAQLRAAYEAFHAAAAAGAVAEDFAPPPDGEWTAEQVIAHVALNDLAMIAVCHSLVHGSALEFVNERCQDPIVLDRWIADAGDILTLIDRGRATSRQVLAALARLDPQQLAADVQCRLLHDGSVMVDGPIPWGSVAIDTQARVHLPAHTGQLADARPGQPS